MQRSLTTCSVADHSSLVSSPESLCYCFWTFSRSLSVSYLLFVPIREFVVQRPAVLRRETRARKPWPWNTVKQRSARVQPHSSATVEWRSCLAAKGMRAGSHASLDPACYHTAMERSFAEALVDADGRSEFVIVVVADIRGFSDFSTRNESPNIAMFIKRFYLQLIEKYFPDANFVKPTGDGLLMTFRYSEKDLLEVGHRVIDACLTCLNEFPSLCKDDPMINFVVPQEIGFGVTRGTACCLYSGDQILDYSGHLLNLAARLNDLARPGGVVVDGNFQVAVLPDAVREQFVPQKVYVRSIADEVPITVLYLKDVVAIPDTALTPPQLEKWETVVHEYSYRAIQAIGTRFRVTLNGRAKTSDKVKITVLSPKRGVKNVSNILNFKGFEYSENAPVPEVWLDMNALRRELAPLKPVQTAKIKIKIEYAPRPLPRT